MKKFIFLLLAFLFITSPVKAEYSSYLCDDTNILSSTTGTPSGSVSNLCVDDTSYLTYTNDTSGYLWQKIDSNVWNFPDNVVIDGFHIEVIMRKTTTGDNSGYYTIYVDKDVDTTPASGALATSASGCVQNAVSPDPYPCGPYLIGNSQATYQAYWRNYDSSHANYVTAEDVMTGTFGIGLRRNSGPSKTFEFDKMWVRVDFHYEDFAITVDDSTADANAGKVYLDLSGGFPLDMSEGQFSCRVDLFERCSGTGVAGFTSQTPVARLYMFEQDPPPKNTNALQGIYATGGFDGTYSFTDVQVPYRPGMDCDYPTIAQCYDTNCESYQTWNPNINDYVTKQRCTDTSIYTSQSVFSGQDNYVPSTVASPSATIGMGSYTDPDCDIEFICSVVDGFKSFIVSMFVPSDDFSSLVVLELQEDLSLRAPFAYIYPVFFFNTTDPTVTTDLPDIEYDFGTIGTEEISLPIFQNATFVNGVVDNVKDFVTFALYLVLVFYLIILGRRLLPQ